MGMKGFQVAVESQQGWTAGESALGLFILVWPESKCRQRVYPIYKAASDAGHDGTGLPERQPGLNKQASEATEPE